MPHLFLHQRQPDLTGGSQKAQPKPGFSVTVQSRLRLSALASRLGCLLTVIGKVTGVVFLAL